MSVDWKWADCTVRTTMLRGFVLTRSFASTRHMRTGGDGSKGGMVLRGRNSLLGLENSLICGGETWLTAEWQIHCHQQEHNQVCARRQSGSGWAARTFSSSARKCKFDLMEIPGQAWRIFSSWRTGRFFRPVVAFCVSFPMTLKKDWRRPNHAEQLRKQRSGWDFLAAGAGGRATVACFRALFLRSVLVSSQPLGKGYEWGPSLGTEF